MTISTENRKAGPYACNGATVVFNFTFKVFVAADVVVTHATSAGVESTLTLNTDYTVALNADQNVNPGGSITTVATYASGITITITSAVTKTQSTDLTSGGSWYPDVVEDMVDRAVINIQQHAVLFDRVLKGPVSDASPIAELPTATARASTFLAFDADGDPIASSGSAGQPASTFADTLLDDTSASAMLTTLGVSTFAKALLDDTSESAVLTTLGISAFAQTLLDDTTAALVLATLGVDRMPGGDVLCPHRNLVVKYVSATTVDADADALLLTDASGTQKRFASLNVTLNIAGTVGAALGLDTGAEANSTWYHVWAIGKTDGTVSCVFSVSTTAPTLPTGYTFYGYLGAVYNNASGNFNTFYQRGTLVGGYFATNALTAGTATAYTPISLSAHIPSTARALRYIAGVSSSSAAACNMLVADDSTVQSDLNQISQVGSANEARTTMELLITAAQACAYKVAGTNAAGNIIPVGWRF